MKILIVKLGSIGDIVHTLPVLAAIRSEMPASRVSWVVEKRSAEILRGNRLIDRLIEIDTREAREGKIVAGLLRSIKQQLRDLRREHFDLAIDLQGLIKSAAIARLSGAPVRYGFSRDGLREPQSRLLLTHTADVPTGLHVIRKNLALAARALGIDIAEREPEFPIFTEPAHKAEAAAIAAEAGGDFAILNPGGGWPTKLWPAERFGELADAILTELGIRSVIVSGPGEEELAAGAIASTRGGSAIPASPSLKGFVELAKLARVYVGGDTGPTHLAVAAKCPIIGIFGPTEWWRNGSLDPADICIERTDIGCRVDCHRRACSNWICLNIDVTSVLEAVRRRLRNASAAYGRPASSK